MSSGEFPITNARIRANDVFRIRNAPDLLDVARPSAVLNIAIMSGIPDVVRELRWQYSARLHLDEALWVMCGDRYTCAID